MLRSSIIPAVLTVTCLLAQQAGAETYHVSPEPLPGVSSAVQFRTIGHAASRVKPGDVVQIHTGTYRETVHVPASGTPDEPIRFEAAPGAHVVISGAERLLDWRRESEGSDRIYSAPWPHDLKTWSGARTHPDDDYHKLIGRMEQVFVDGYRLQQVLNRSQLSRGTFWVDDSGGRIHVWALNNAKLGPSVAGDPPVEASHRKLLWEQEGSHVIIRGLRFRHAANQAQGGAMQVKGSGVVLENCVFEWNNSIGASFLADDILVDGCIFENNGQMGWGAYRAHNLRVTNSLTRNNNIKNFSRSWEAGGNKIVLSRNVVVEHSRFEDNRGVGLWFDVGNEDCIVRNCLIAGNENAGLFYEISYGLHAHDNVIIGNGFASYGGAWGASGGVSLASSPDCLLERNLILGNKEGFQFREHMRRTPRIDDPKGTPEHAIWNRDIVVRNNIIALNYEGQIWAWFEISDERYWPRAMQAEMRTRGEAGAEHNASAYKDESRRGVPDDLSLETLNLRFENNLLTPSSRGDLWNWGLPWSKHRRYTTLSEVRQELGIDTASVVAPFIFQSLHARDLRIPPDSPAIRLEAYPRGEVPGVQLGVEEETARR